MKKVFLSLFLLILIIEVFSQCGSPVGMFEVNGASNDNCHSIVSTVDGGYATISVASGGSLDGQWVVSRFDGAFNLIWSVQYGTTANETGDNLLILATNSGDFIVAGHQLQGSLRVMSYMRLDSQGNVIWNKQIPAFTNPGETAADIIELTIDQFLIVGTTNSYGSGSSDGFALCFNLNGDVLWQNSYGTSENEHFYSVSILPNGNLLCVGEITGIGLLVELTSQGVLISAERIQGNTQSLFMDSAVLPSGEVLLVGRVNVGGSNSLIMRLSENLEVIESRRLLVGNAASLISTIGQLPNGTLAFSTILSNNFSNVGTPALLVLDGVQNLNLVNCVTNDSQAPHQALIRGQNLIISGDNIIQVFWTAQGNAANKILVANQCGETSCAVQTDVSILTQNLSLTTIPFSVTAFGVDIPLLWNSSIYSQEVNMECENLCNSSFNVAIPEVLCTGESYDLTAIPDGTYALGDIIWSIDGINVGNQSTFTLQSSELGNYNLNVIAYDELNTCFSELTFAIQIDSLPNLPLVPDYLFCSLPADELAQYVDFAWFDNAGGVVNPASISEPGVYTMSSENECGVSQTNVNIQLDVFNFSFQQILLCEENQIVTLNLPPEYSFFVGGVEVSNQIEITANGPSIVQVINDNSCSLDVPLSIVDNSNLINANLFPDTLYECFVAGFWEDINGYDYNLFFENTDTPVDNFSDGGTYIVEVFGPCPTQTYEVEFLSGVIDFVEWNQELTLCNGESVQIIPSNLSYPVSINNQAVFDEYFVTQAGNYLVNSPDNVCGTSLLIVATSNNSGAEIPQTICESDVSSVDFSFFRADGSWSFETNAEGDWNPSIGENLVSFENECGSSNYSIEVLPTAFCTCYAWVPNSFTPDFDGNNDVWAPVFNIEPYWYEVTVYNRWGQMVFFSDTYNSVPWISDFQLRKEYHQQNDIYNYILKYRCEENVDVIVKKGFVAIIR